MVKAVVFDLDNVLVNLDDVHYESLNAALEYHGLPKLGRMEHDLIYRGRPTRTKLKLYQERRNVRVDIESINAQKQTMMDFSGVQVEPLIMDTLEALHNAQYRIGVASNAVRATVVEVLERMGIDQYFSVVLSNEDAVEPKPSPEIYYRAQNQLNVLPEEMLIVEDSTVGIEAARASGSHVLVVSGPDEVNYITMAAACMTANTPNVLVPAAGEGKRFAEAGYNYPKPFIPLPGGSLLNLALSNIDFEAQVTILLQKEHNRRFKAYHPGIDVITVDGTTEGAACTVLLARDVIDSPRELILMNSDQYLTHFSMEDFLIEMEENGYDAGMVTFKSDNPKWSYAELDNDGYVRKVQEKKVLPGGNATVGIYWYRSGAQFVRFADRMIERDDRVNGEFYVAPVFNYFIEAGKKVGIYEIDEADMHGLGTPEDLEAYLARRLV